MKMSTSISLPWLVMKKKNARHIIALLDITAFSERLETTSRIAGGLVRLLLQASALPVTLSVNASLEVLRASHRSCSNLSAPNS